MFSIGTQLRGFKPRIENFKIYRIFPGGDIEFTSKDGVFPEKVNEGREKVGHNQEGLERIKSCRIEIFYKKLLIKFFWS